MNSSKLNPTDAAFCHHIQSTCQYTRMYCGDETSSVQAAVALLVDACGKGSADYVMTLCMKLGHRFNIAGAAATILEMEFSTNETALLSRL